MNQTLAAIAAGYEIRGEAATRITAITEDSRRAGPGTLFVAVAGTADDGHRYVEDAVRRGAAAVCVAHTGAAPRGIASVIAPSTRRALAVMASRFFGEPGRDLEIVGFTGTFGKTTTSHVLQRLLDAAGRRTAVVGSLGARFGEVSHELAGMTTPSPVDLHRALGAIRDAGATTVVMEVTSHALAQERPYGLSFAGGLIAAIRPGEHVDFHRNYEDYVAAKRLFLDYLAPGALLAYDADNRAAATLARERTGVRAAGFSLRRTSIGGAAPLTERRDANIDDRRILSFADALLDDQGALIHVDDTTLRSALLGRANLRNVALALTFARAAGLPLDAASATLASLTPLRRRMERFTIAGRTVLDDTAGHPESFDATFEVAELLPARRVVVAYALRGSRGTDINRRNALALAEHAMTIRARHTIVTEADDTTGPHDRVTDGEREAARRAFHERGVRPSWHARMRDAMAEAASATEPGDLIVLVGAQGMNAGRDALTRALEQA